jgi:hypothetical protein
MLHSPITANQPLFMKITLVFLPVLLLAACNTVKIYTNENFMYTAKQPPSKGPVSGDSCYVLGPTALLPKGAVYVCSTRAKASAFWSMQPSAEETSMLWVKEEAQKYGANIIRIVDEGGGFLNTELYRLQEPALTAYRLRLDSLDEANSHLLRVQVCNLLWKKTPIYFNDSLMGTCPGATVRRDAGRGPACHPLQFELSTPGSFCIPMKGKNRTACSTALELGKEYRVIIGDGRAPRMVDSYVVPPSGRVLQ